MARIVNLRPFSPFQRGHSLSKLDEPASEPVVLIIDGVVLYDSLKSWLIEDFVNMRVIISTGEFTVQRY